MSTTPTLTVDEIRSRLHKQFDAKHPNGNIQAAPLVDIHRQLFGEPVQEQVPPDKVAYSDIIGEGHPSGEYYFTVYEESDWDTKVRPLIPEVDEAHVFDHDYALAILMGIEYDKSVFAFGPPGTGKSVTPEQICARIKYPFKFIAGMGGTEPADYIGSPWVADGDMSWKDAEASFCVRHGVFMLYDEPFKASAQTNMCFQSLLDYRRTLKLYGHPDPIEGNLKAHPKFRMCLADNVRGFGDDMAKYAAEVQDQSTLNRTAYKVSVDYPPAEVEEQILMNRFPEATEFLVKKVVSLAGLLRTAWKKGEVSAPYSLRDTQELVENALHFHNLPLAFTSTYYGVVKEDAERQSIQKIWTTVYGTQLTLGG
jgi:MoxR-like ATPase